MTEAGPQYRGQLSSSLVHYSYESVAEFLWQAPPGEWRPRPLPLLENLPVRELFMTTTSLLALHDPQRELCDPLKQDEHANAIVDTSRAIIASLVACLAPQQAEASDVERSIAERLAWCIAKEEPSPQFVAATNAALVLLADHDIAIITLGVRLAASKRTDIYDALIAGLGMLGGKRQGRFSEFSWALLGRASEIGPEQAVEEMTKRASPSTEFESPLHPHGDPRYFALRSLLDEVLTAEETNILDGVHKSAEPHGLSQPSINLAVAALVRSVGAAPETGFALFTIARLAGWVAHYLEELEEMEFRFRVDGIYVTPSRPVHPIADRTPLCLNHFDEEAEGKTSALSQNAVPSDQLDEHSDRSNQQVQRKITKRKSAVLGS
jgi:citrate synthase